MLLERVVRLDFLEFSPDPSGFVGFAHLPQRRREVCT